MQTLNIHDIEKITMTKTIRLDSGSYVFELNILDDRGNRTQIILFSDKPTRLDIKRIDK